MISSFKKPRNSATPADSLADTDGVVPEYTRSSDTRKKFADKKSSQSSFGRKKAAAERPRKE